MKQEHNESRRQFIQKSAVFGTGIILAGPASQRLFAQGNQSPDPAKRVASKGYAARDTSGKLSPWTFERRPVGDEDILIDIKFSGICHSDIHQIRGEWGAQQYPQVPGHEIAGVVAAVGRNAARFKVGDHAGVGCMVDSCGTCESCKHGEEQHCDNGATLFTYGYPDKTSPTGITQGGYANNIVVKERFAISLPKTIRLQDAAPLLCAGITTYSPLVKASIKKGDKVGVAGIGGLGHLAIKLAVAKGAEVYRLHDFRKQSERHPAVWSEGGCHRGFRGKAQALQKVARLHDFHHSGELRRCSLRIAGEAVWQLHSSRHAGERRSDHQ